MSMYLRIKQLNKTYGSRQVVSDLELEVQEGEVLSLLGPSGCGKTTILRMLAGLVAPDSGYIEVGGRVFFDGKRGLLVEERGLGMVFQDYALWPHMTVAQNISFGLRLRRMPARQIKERLHTLLELVNLPGYEQRYPYQLSGGQQQRVAVARALATEPRLLLLDEPLSSLDAALRETMSAELVQLFKRLKITTINVTHDQNEAMTMSDRITILRDGQVQQIGTPTELYLQPQNAFVASFMGQANMLPGALTDSDSETASIQLHDEDVCLSGQISAEARKHSGSHYFVCRPAHIAIAQEPPSAPHQNILTGQVVQTFFVAGRWRTHIKAGRQQQYTIQAFTDQPLQPSQSVWLAFPPTQSLIVPA
ncbi:ABC transporter ATP-binding protein [Dictyobacter formicarum]|uniref:ABC transporter ATP-binding protein n=1 Tax=Dictyobacter formicarum TaxID=2778368 RepID=A0ABQ3VIT0_9CHLR|nr:ABC transporter ATP-binding protein [Dictyobacter formicarum]GHO85975.1 ABC transporter ATP-binding protein [Dictyobacter formicarum]